MYYAFPGDVAAKANDIEEVNPVNPVNNSGEGTLGEKLTLPDFSSGVKNALSQGNSSEVWSQMIDELLTFYARKYPDRLKCFDDYQIVGRLMYSTYPSIARFGTHKWVYVLIKKYRMHVDRIPILGTLQADGCENITFNDTSYRNTNIFSI